MKSIHDLLHPTSRPGTQSSMSETSKQHSGEMLQGGYNEELHQFLNGLNEHYRNLENFIVQINRLPKIKIYSYNMGSWATGQGALICQNQGQPIRGIFIENYSATVPITVYAGPSGNGVYPLIICNTKTWHRLPTDEIFAISFVPTNSAGGELFRVIVSEEQFTPSMGATV